MIVCGDTGRVETSTVPIIGLYGIGAFGARGGTGASLGSDVALRRGEGLRIVVGHDGSEGDAVFAGGGGQRQRVWGRGGECEKGLPRRRSCDQGAAVEAWTST